jgi:SWI/SNF-related matrix-associated actin-dependent regulator 1 of chromatin subfamily A
MYEMVLMQVLTDLPPKSRQIEFCLPTDTQKEAIQKIMRASKKEYLENAAAIAVDSVVPGKKAKKAAKKAVVQKSTNSLTNVLMQLRKASNHQLLMRNHYNDDILPSIAKDILRVIGELILGS